METFRHPGFIDVHTHLRDPSTNGSESMRSGTISAVIGGAVALADMPNNQGDPTWTIDAQNRKGSRILEAAVIPVGMNVGSQPESDNIGELEMMSEHALMMKLYATKTTGNDNEYEVPDFLPAIQEWHRVAPFHPIAVHPGEENLEDFIDYVAGFLDHPLHVCHVSDVNQAQLVKRAKRKGLPVTAGVTPHHLFKTSHATFTEGWFARMQPPLANQEVAEDLWKLLVDGTIDIVESDHAPHSTDSKWSVEHANPHDEEGSTCFGVPNIEHLMPLLLRQMKLERISPERLIEATNTIPARLLGLNLSKDLTQVIWNMNDYRINDEESLQTGAGWSPFLGMLATGEVAKTTIGREVVYTKMYERSRKLAIATTLKPLRKLPLIRGEES